MARVNNCILKHLDECSSDKRPHGIFCGKHWSQYRRDIIDKRGNKIREFKHKGPQKHFFNCLVCNAVTGKRGKFCAKHWGQYYSGRIDINGKELRSKKPNKIKIFTHCIAKNDGPCSNYEHGGKFCPKHWYHHKIGVLDDSGNKTGKKLIYERYSECIAKNKNPNNTCSKRYHGRFCGKHRNQYTDGLIDINGNLIRNAYTGANNFFRVNCSIPGCKGLAGHRGFCRNHYREIVLYEKFEEYPSIIPMSKFALQKDKRSWPN